MSTEHLHEIWERLRSLETMTWGEIEQKKTQHGSQSHPMPVTDICKRARDRLVEIKQDDIDELFSLRVAGAKRIWGIRRVDVLDILWWDPNHEVCPMEKR